MKASLVFVASSRLATTKQQNLVSLKKKIKKKEKDFPIPPVKPNTGADPTSGHSRHIFHPASPVRGGWERVWEVVRQGLY